jgi:DNA-binding GntR family transcriptional regulator
MENSVLNFKIRTYKSLREEIYDTLRDAIINGELKAGMRLVETHIAEQLGVSRTPVREAIHKLESEGLITDHSQKGLIVSEVSSEDAEEIQGIRMILERYAARLAATRIKDEELKRLEELLDQSEEYIKIGDIDRVLKLNTKFHNLIHSISGSKRLQGLIRQHSEFIQRFRRAALYTKGHAAQALKEHRLIVEALRMKSPDTVEVIISQHIAENTRVVIEWAEQQECKKR